MMPSVDSDVNQYRYINEEGLVSTKVRAMMPLIIIRVPIMSSMASSSRRGVGIKGTGRSITKMVSGMLSARVVIVWALYDVHCTIKVSPVP